MSEHSSCASSIKNRSASRRKGSRLRRFCVRLGIAFGILILLMTGAIAIAAQFCKADVEQYRMQGKTAPKARKLHSSLLESWKRQGTAPAEQKINPEWDFMARTFLVLSLANQSFNDPSSREDNLSLMDAIIQDTLKIERASGCRAFLLGYGQTEMGWIMKPARSQFIDGEIALMLASRRFIAEREEYKDALQQRMSQMVDRMKQSPVLCAESYPNECWVFCNSISLASIRMADVLDGTDRSHFLQEWIQTAQEKLIDAKTGLLISAFTVEGTPVQCAYGPEGSSIWMTSHMLQIVDSEFAAGQYDLAKKKLGGNLLGFGYSREWAGGMGVMQQDIDSGFIIPVLGASPSASGLALVAAAAFDDRPYYQKLLTSIQLFAMPNETQTGLRYGMSNYVGDSVVLYSMTLGPLWEEIQKRMIGIEKE